MNDDSTSRTNNERTKKTRSLREKLAGLVPGLGILFFVLLVIFFFLMDIRSLLSGDMRLGWCDHVFMDFVCDWFGW